MEPLNLAICDDLPKEREALLALLEQAPIATNCTQFGSSEELLEAFRPGKFDLLLMDIYMDGMTGVEGGTKNPGDGRCHPHRLYHHQHRAYPGELPAVGAEISWEKPVRQKDINDLLHLVKLQRDSAPRLAIAKRRDAKNPAFQSFSIWSRRPIMCFCIAGTEARSSSTASCPTYCPSWRDSPFSAPTKATA